MRTAAILLVLACGLEAQTPAQREAGIRNEVARAAQARASKNAKAFRFHLQRAASLVGNDLRLAGVLAASTLAAHFHLETESICRQMLAQAPTDPLLNAIHGAALIELKRHAEALAPLDRALAAHPKEASWVALKGRALLYLDQAEASRKLLDRALGYAPKERMILELDAEWFFRTLDPKGCEKACLRLLSHHATSLRGHTLLVRALRMQRRHDDGVAAATRGLKRHPAHPELLLERGIVRLAGGDAKGAITDLEAARKGMPLRAVPYQHLARAYAQLGDRENARKARARWKQLSKGH